MIPFWVPTKEWNGRDAFIIGGGPSLLNFDWRMLLGRNVIGLNAAIRLGPSVVSLGFFGDADWFEREKWMLEEAAKTTRLATLLYPNHHLRRCDIPWLKVLERIPAGCGQKGQCAWNHSTGAAAINLALLLGCHRIFLLGFDCRTDAQKKSHWHRWYPGTVPDATYGHFLNGFETLARSLRVLPSLRHVQIRNVVRDSSSLLDCFPKMGMEEFEKMIRPDPLRVRELERMFQWKEAA